MKIKLLIFFLLSAVLSTTNAQLMEKKLHFQFSYGIANAMGKRNTDEKSFVLPSLYANYSKGSQLSFRTTYKLRDALSIGAEFYQTNFNNWRYEDGNDLFNNSTSNVTSVGICVKFHTQFRQEGIYNRLQLYAIFSPIISRIKLNLQKPIFYVDPPGSSLTAEIETNLQYIGMNAGAGISFSVTQSCSVFAEGGLLISGIGSQLHNDKVLKAGHLNLGLSIHFMKSKRFY